MEKETILERRNRKIGPILNVSQKISNIFGNKEDRVDQFFLDTIC